MILLKIQWIFLLSKKKLNNFSYTNVREYRDDMDLIFNNCFRYNGPNSYVGEICSKVKNEYEKLFYRLNLDKFL